MKPRKILSPDEAYNRAVALCDKCEQCSPDIAAKLSRWGISSAESTKIIARLKETGYLDDLRFARAYAHFKMAYSGWGKAKIINGLWAKRLERKHIDAAFDNIDPDEYKQVAVRVMKSKIRALNGGISTYENRMKAMRFGVGRGFSARLVSAIINMIARQDEKSDQ